MFCWCLQWGINVVLVSMVKRYSVTCVFGEVLVFFIAGVFNEVFIAGVFREVFMH